MSSTRLREAARVLRERAARGRLLDIGFPDLEETLADWLDDEALRDSYLPASARVADLILGGES